MGHYTRANAEFVLLGARGHPRRASAGVPSLVVAPRQEHSRKPDVVRQRIDALVGEVPRIELFARGRLPVGWDGWGLEYEPG
jgi:N6-adenosine-specific RNA methylase IME4